MAMTLTQFTQGMRDHFHVRDPQIFINLPMSALTKKAELDIFRFEDLLKARGYNESERGSIRDYVETHYSIDAAEFIADAIKGSDYL